MNEALKVYTRKGGKTVRIVTCFSVYSLGTSCEGGKAGMRGEGDTETSPSPETLYRSSSSPI